jgi:hypothetical protein
MDPTTFLVSTPRIPGEWQAAEGMIKVGKICRGAAPSNNRIGMERTVRATMLQCEN